MINKLGTRGALKKLPNNFQGRAAEEELIPWLKLDKTYVTYKWERNVWREPTKRMESAYKTYLSDVLPGKAVVSHLDSTLDAARSYCKVSLMEKGEIGLVFTEIIFSCPSIIFASLLILE